LHKKGDRLLFFKKKDCLYALAVHTEKVACPLFFLFFIEFRIPGLKAEEKLKLTAIVDSFLIP
jgi:hypothetical protein